MKKRLKSYFDFNVLVCILVTKWWMWFSYGKRGAMEGGWVSCWVEEWDGRFSVVVWGGDGGINSGTEVDWMKCHLSWSE